MEMKCCPEQDLARSNDTLTNRESIPQLGGRDAGEFAGQHSVGGYGSATLEPAEFPGNIIHILDIPLPTPLALLPPAPFRRLQ